MPLGPLLFSFHGRIHRQTFWLWNLAYYILVPSCAFIIHTLAPGAVNVLLPILLLILLWPDLAITCKRWHDRGKSAYWLLLSAPLIAGRMMTPIALPGTMQDETVMNMPEMGGSIIALVCGLWIFIECGLLRGTIGDNRYGPEPK
ncbi:DUF805 domain-containing protein [Vibrio sp. SM6]|uniref:DUF805 domain-containing protein n=1 Tax=Vibrio agarilyticus TaxID=2726741 RepID=A0A7X8YHE8_9VIBR|nr:DUF805 domain-containing protein [Vibrio agarilyticus]NLS13510.1 DUF805 domain-containing protein [Vibrio agarilyticus]